MHRDPYKASATFANPQVLSAQALLHQYCIRESEDQAEQGRSSWQRRVLHSEPRLQSHEVEITSAVILSSISQIRWISNSWKTSVCVRRPKETKPHCYLIFMVVSCRFKSKWLEFESPTKTLLKSQWNDSGTLESPTCSMSVCSRLPTSSWTLVNCSY